MTQLVVNSEEVSALFAERKRYESWISTLESKRSTTPPHVFERVHADYSARLQRVLEQLASHHASLRELERSLAARLGELESEEARCRDEAAEVELRALVGELTEEQKREVAERTEATLATLSEERARVEGELSNVRTILEAAAPRAPEGDGEAAAPAQPAAAQAEPAAASEQPAAAPANVAPPLSGAPAVTADVASPVGPAADDWQLAFEQTPEPRETPSASQSVPPPSSGDGAPVSAPSEPGPFDDLEFLKTMMEPRASGGVATRGAGADQSPRPTGAAQPAESPTEQPKTLRCQECSTMNYPTEWYCERCGAELAAL
jgi:hypothetical protein